MADKVRPGQEIKASQLNNVIDAMSIGQPNALQPFRNTTTGGLVNGGASYITKARSQFEDLFTVTYGPGVLSPDIYDLQTGSWTGIWAQVADWEQLDLMLYHGTFFPSPVSLFLIDPTSQNGKLIWVIGSTLISKIGKLPICESKHSAGIAVFQVFNSSSTGSTDAYNGSCCIVIGDFTKFGADQGWRPDFSGDNGFDDYLTAIKASDGSAAFFGNKDEIALRFSSPLYVQKSDLEDEQLTRPVTYSVGQQHVESIPDGNNSAASIGKDVYLSSLEFTPATQFNTYNAVPTFSTSLWNFHKKSPDIDDLSTIVDDLSSYDILLKHKFDHPSETVVTRDNCKAVLEYLPLSCLIGTVDSKISALQLSSVQEEKWTDPDTGKDTKYHQFFGFTDRVLDDYELSDGLDVVVRDYFTTGGNGARTNYISLSGLAKKLSSNVEVDSWATQGAQRSIDWNTQNDKKYLQLYNFDKPGYDDTLRVNLAYGEHRYATKDGSGQYPDPYVEFVVRDRNGNHVVKYDALDIYAPPISASDITDLTTVISAIVDRGCSCDLGPLSAKVDQLSSDLSNYWKVGGTNDDNCYGQSIGNSSQVLAIDIDNGGLWYESSQTLDWHACELYNQNGADGPGDICLKWADRQGYDSGGNITLDWENGKLSKPGTGVESVNWKVGYAQDPSGSGVVVNWNTGQLWADGNTRTLNWKHKQLIGDWSTQNGGLTIASGNTLTIGNTTITEAQLQALLALI